MALDIPSVRDVLVILIVLHSLAISTTFLRLVHRMRIERLWWDDFWALVAVLSDVILLVIFLAIRPTSTPQTGKNLTIHSAGKFVTLLTFATALWAARLSVAVTIVRLLPEGVLMRKIAKFSAVLFGLFWFIVALQKVFFCGKRWTSVPNCNIPRYTGILELCTDILADLWLTLAPAYMLWKMKIQRRHYRLILCIFECGIFTALSSIAHSVFILLKSPVWVGLSGHIEVTIAITVSNLLVLVTYIYRVFCDFIHPALSSTDESTESNDESTRGNERAPTHIEVYSARTVPLTAVELTQFSHLGSTFDILTRSDRTVTFISSFTYPTTHGPSRSHLSDV